MLHHVKKILGGLYLAAIVVLFLIVAFVFWGSRNGWGFAAILSGSMEPVFNVGGLVVTEPVATQTLKVGDAISFVQPNFTTTVCHRINDIKFIDGQEYLQTKGDANKEADQNLVPLSSVKGKVLLHIPYLGRLLEIKNLGATKISLIGKQIPAGALPVAGIGLLFIGLMLKETTQDIFWPAKRWRRKSNTQQNARLLKRRQAFKIR